MRAAVGTQAFALRWLALQTLSGLFFSGETSEGFGAKGAASQFASVGVEFFRDGGGDGAGCSTGISGKARGGDLSGEPGNRSKWAAEQSAGLGVGSAGGGETRDRNQSAFEIGSENFDNGVGSGLAQSKANESSQSAAALVEADESAFDDPDSASGGGRVGRENPSGRDVFGEPLGKALREIGGEFVFEFLQLGTFSVHTQVADINNKRADKDFFGNRRFLLDPVPV
jgi:hypothetical protein